jgi:TPR repeat protein
MKKILLALLMILLSFGFAWSGDFEDTKKLAAQGDSNAQYILGSIYLMGNDLPQDSKKAIYWFTKAAEQGVEGAQYNVGIMYKAGNGVRMFTQN